MAVEIVVTPMEPHWFGVQVEEGGVRTGHRVRLTDGFVDDLLLGDIPREAIVREAVAWMLDREPGTAIPSELSLDDVEESDHRLAPELRLRLGA